MSIQQQPSSEQGASQGKGKGPAKKRTKNRRPPWWVGGSEYEKGLGSDLFVNIFLIVFLSFPHRETPKNVINKFREKVGLGFLVEFFVKAFRHDVFCKTFFLCVLNSDR
jgi:hypothetical protein